MLSERCWCEKEVMVAKQDCSSQRKRISHAAGLLLLAAVPPEAQRLAVSSENAAAEVAAVESTVLCWARLLPLLLTGDNAELGQLAAVFLQVAADFTIHQRPPLKGCTSLANVADVRTTFRPPARSWALHVLTAV